MFPIATATPTTTPAPPTLVATPLPENFAQRVPVTNVPPSVSNVQISNNARGNGFYAPIENTGGLSVPVVSGEGGTGTAGSVTSNISVPAPFLAQLMSQQVPPALQGALSNVLLSYDQMVRFGIVKHEPSLATLPPSPPAGVFGKILAQERVMRPVAETPPPVAQAPQPTEVIPVQSAPVEAAEAAPVVIRQQPTPEQTVEAVQPLPAAPIEVKELPKEQPAERPRISSVKAAIAYLVTDVRAELQAPPAVTKTA